MDIFHIVEFHIVDFFSPGARVIDFIRFSISHQAGIAAFSKTRECVFSKLSQMPG